MLILVMRHGPWVLGTQTVLNRTQIEHPILFLFLFYIYTHFGVPMPYLHSLAQVE